MTQLGSQSVRTVLAGHPAMHSPEYISEWDLSFNADMSAADSRKTVRDVASECVIEI